MVDPAAGDRDQPKKRKRMTMKKKKPQITQIKQIFKVKNIDLVPGKVFLSLR